MTKKKFEKKNNVGGRTASRVNKLIQQRRAAALENKWDRGPREAINNKKDRKHLSDQFGES